MKYKANSCLIYGIRHAKKFGKKPYLATRDNLFFHFSTCPDSEFFTHFTKRHLFLFSNYRYKLIFTNKTANIDFSVPYTGMADAVFSKIKTHAILDIFSKHLSLCAEIAAFLLSLKQFWKAKG